MMLVDASRQSRSLIRAAHNRCLTQLTIAHIPDTRLRPHLENPEGFTTFVGSFIQGTDSPPLVGLFFGPKFPIFSEIVTKFTNSPCIGENDSENSQQILPTTWELPNVNSMETVLSRLTQLAPLGAVLLAEVKSSSLTIGELAAQLDVAKREVSMLRAIAKVFDAEELAQATKLRLSVSKLRLISRTDKQLANPDINRRDFRLDLMKTAVDCTVDELAEHIKSLIGELNAGYNRRRKWYLRCSELADADNMRHIIMKLPSHVATRIMNSLEPQGRQWVQEGQAVDKSEGLAKALADRVLHGIDVTTLEQVEATENPNNPRDLRQRPCFLVPIANIQSHNDGTITNTDGESVNIRELVDARLAEFGFAVACYNGPDGNPRPQQLLEVKRLADADDRFISIVSHLICQNPHCRIPAVRCETHHINRLLTRRRNQTRKPLPPLPRTQPHQR